MAIDATDQEFRNDGWKLEIIIAVVSDEVADRGMVIFQAHYPTIECMMGQDIGL